MHFLDWKNIFWELISLQMTSIIFLSFLLIIFVLKLFLKFNPLLRGYKIATSLLVIFFLAGGTLNTSVEGRKTEMMSNHFHFLYPKKVKLEKYLINHKVKNKFLIKNKTIERMFMNKKVHEKRYKSKRFFQVLSSFKNLKNIKYIEMKISFPEYVSEVLNCPEIDAIWMLFVSCEQRKRI